MKSLKDLQAELRKEVMRPLPSGKVVPFEAEGPFELDCGNQSAALAHQYRALEAKYAALFALCERYRKCIESGMRVYNGNGHPQRAEAEIWNQEAKEALGSDKLHESLTKESE